MELKWFKPSAYTQGISHILGLIRKELIAVQPVDTSDIVWTRSSSGIRAYLASHSPETQSDGYSLTQEESTDSSAVGYFCISLKLYKVTGEDGTETTQSTMQVVNRNDIDSGIAGVVKLADGTLVNVPTFTLSKSTTKKYVYLVMDVSHAPSIYIMESDINTLTSVKGGAMLIGSYMWDEQAKSATINQNIRQTIPVELGPTYIGPYCILPGEPSSSGMYNYAVNPAGTINLSSARCYVNGKGVGYAQPLSASVDRLSSVRAFVGWVAPRYSEDTGVETSSGYVLLSSDGNFSTDVDVSKDITGNTSGVVDIIWRSSITDTIQSILFDDTMLES